MTSSNFSRYWIDASGRRYTINSEEYAHLNFSAEKFPFLVWVVDNNSSSGYWANSATCGQAPYKSIENPETYLKASFKPPHECVAWAMQNLGRAIEFEGGVPPRRLVKVANSILLQSQVGTRRVGWCSCATWPNAPGRPVDGGW